MHIEIDIQLLLWFLNNGEHQNSEAYYHSYLHDQQSSNYKFVSEVGDAQNI
jgi:hypothetical protein